MFKQINEELLMTIENHITALETRHKELEQKLETQLAHASFDEDEVAALKKQKLEIKDELAKLQTNVA